MNASLWLLAVTAAAGPMDGSACPCTNGAAQPRVVYSVPAESHSSLLERLGSLFQRNHTHAAPGSPYSAPHQAIQTVSYQQASASAEPPQAQEIIQTSAAQPMIPQLSKEFDKKVGAAEDYGWVTGQLFFIHADGGMWMIRYASQDQEDKLGGSVVLAPAVNMKNFREGDLVCVHGAVLKQERANRHLGGGLYRVDRIDLIERAD